MFVLLSDFSQPLLAVGFFLCYLLIRLVERALSCAKIILGQNHAMPVLASEAIRLIAGGDFSIIHSKTFL
jgi:hypothetical protein